MSITIPLCIINLRINRETALQTMQVFLNKNPDFQREYEAWDAKLKTRFIETILIGRSMNPIWTIRNDEDDSEEILDGMHRITTAVDFLNGKFALSSKFFTDDNTGDYYDKKKFCDLSKAEKDKIRNYNFIFNQLDSSYRINVNKRRDMYEILNRSSKTLNDFEFNKVLYGNYFNIISKFKDDLNNLFFNKKDSRGSIENEIIELIVLSRELPHSWSSINSLRNKFYLDELGDDQESVERYLERNTDTINANLTMLRKIISTLKDNHFFSQDKATFKSYYLPYKFIISRLLFKFKNISLFNRHIMHIIQELKINITDKKIDDNRNGAFQQKMIKQIDLIIDTSYRMNFEKRIFSKEDIIRKKNEQQNKCASCNTEKDNYEADHIQPWSTGGSTDFENLQMLCKDCHRKKSASESSAI